MEPVDPWVAEMNDRVIRLFGSQLGGELKQVEGTAVNGSTVTSKPWDVRHILGLPLDFENISCSTGTGAADSGAVVVGAVPGFPIRGLDVRRALIQIRCSYSAGTGRACGQVR
jgi:hypothetical protein